MPTDEQKADVVNEQGTPIKRIGSADKAFTIFERIRKNSEQLAVQNARIQAQQEGYAPHSQKKLKAEGLSWVSNVNFGASRAASRLNSASIWNMFTSVPAFVDMRLRDTDLESGQEPTIDYGSIIASEYSDTLTDSPDFYYNTLIRIREMVNYGMGPVVWKDEYDWRSEAVKNANFMYPPKTGSNPADMKIFGLRDEIEPDEFIEYIEDEKVAKEEGWNVDAVKKLLVKYYYHGQDGANQSRNYSGNEWQSILTQMKNKDIETNLNDMAGVRVAHLFTVEVDDGSVSHYIFAEELVSSNTGEKPEREFLYKSERKYGSIMEALHNMLFDIGDGYLRGVRGLAYEIYPTDDISNRLINSILDGVMMVSGLLVQPKSGGDSQALKLLKKGPVTAVPPGLDIVQSSFQPMIQQALQALDLIYQIQNNNAGVYKSRSESPISRDARSATEVEIEAANEAKFETSQSAWYYAQWEKWHQETLRRLFNEDYPAGHPGKKERDDFLERCRKRGVPDSMLKYDVWRIRAVRAIGMGSPVMAQRLTDWLLSIRSLLDEAGSQNALRDALQARFGPDKVDRYATLHNRDQQSSTHHTLAALENNDLKEGSDCIVGVDNMHKIHLQVLIGGMMPYSQAFVDDPTSVDPMFLAQYFQKALQHGATHLAYMQRDVARKAEADQFEQALNGLLVIFKKLLSEVQKIQKAREVQAQELQKRIASAEDAQKQAEMALELEKIRNQYQIDLIKTKNLNDTRIAKLETSIAAMVRKTQADIARKDFVAFREQSREDQVAASEIRRNSQSET